MLTKSRKLYEQTQFNNRKNDHMEIFLSIIFQISKMLNQHSIVILIKGYSGNMQRIYRRTPMLKLISIKLLCNFNEIILRHGCSPVNLLHIFRIPSPKNTSRGLILHMITPCSQYQYFVLCLLHQERPLSEKLK